MADLKQGTTVGGNEVLHTGNFNITNYSGFKGAQGPQELNYLTSLKNTPPLP